MSTMRGPAGWSRSIALTLFLIGAGAASHEAHPIPVESEGEASLVLADAPIASALPASAWTIALDRSAGTPPKPGRRRVQGPTTPLPVAPDASTRERGPLSSPRTSSASLLGLPAAPANAPPGF